MRNTFVRYGRRLTVPSTVQIMHELKALSAEEEVRAECAVKERLAADAGWNEIYAHRAEKPVHVTAS